MDNVIANVKGERFSMKLVRYVSVYKRTISRIHREFEDNIIIVGHILFVYPSC